MNFKKRAGFSLVDVALATVVIALGTLGASRFFTGVYEELSPQANGGGLRRYIMAETLLKAQAEAMRATQYMPATAADAKLVTEPPNAGFTLSISVPTDVSTTYMQYTFYDMSVTDQNNTIAQLTVSCLRAFSGGVDAKIGL